MRALDSVGNILAEDIGNANFTISPAVTAPTVTVTAPNGGESWTAGSTQTITWSGTGSSSNMTYYKIALSTDGGATWPSAGTANDLTPSGLYSPSARSLSWAISASLNTSQARIRVRALDSVGNILAEDIGDANFTISPTVTAPTAQTNAASSVGTTTAILNATVTNTGGSSIIDARFEWTSSSFPGTVIYSVPVSGNVFSSTLTGLQPNTTYAYRAYAKNSAGLWNSAVNNVTFTTSGTAQAPTAQTNAASNVGTTTATLNATVPNTGGTSIIDARFEWTSTSFPGTVINSVPVSGNAFSSTLTGLQPNTTYTYHAYAKNSAGLWNSAVNNVTFTTLPVTGTSSLNGFVYDSQSGQALGNATVTLGAYSRTTSSNGYYSFSGIASGSYNLSASLAGYATSNPASVNIATTPSRNINLTPDFTSNPTASFSGYLRDATSGMPIAKSGVTITLTNGPSTVTPAVTDGSGYFSFPSFTSGNYLVSVSSVNVTTPPAVYLPYNKVDYFAGAHPPDILLARNQTVLGSKTDSGYSADPVNTATGNYVYSKVDLKLPGPGMNFVFERNYNAQDATNGPLGFGWNHTYNAQLIVDASSNVTIRWGDSKADTYTLNASGGFSPQIGFAIFDTLTAIQGGGYKLLKKDQTVYNFDSSNRLASIVDKNGNTVALNYTGSNLTAITDTAGRVIAFTYDGSNRITAIADPISRTIQFGYDASGNLVSATDANGKITIFTYDANHQVLTVVDPRGNTVVTNTYDANKVVASQKDAKLGQTTYVYDETNKKTTVTQPLGRVTVDHYDNLRRLVQQDDAYGHSTLYAYDSVGNRALVTNKNGFTTTYAYDAVGNVIGKTTQFGASTSITYDPITSNPLIRTDELGKTTTFQYDGNGNLNRTTDALGGISTATYSAKGLLLTITDPLLNQTISAYDSQGNLTTVTDALGKATIYTYDAAGRRLTKKDALNRVVTFAYDANDNLLSVTDSDSLSVTCTYDGNNNKLTTTDKRGKTTFYTYDMKDLLATITDPLGGVTTNAYDALDQKLSITDARGGVTQYAYNLVGNLGTVTDALGKVTQYTYDLNGNRIQTTNPLGNVTNFFYDALDRLVQTIDPIGNLTATEYDAAGRKTKVTDANGKATSFTYDAIGHLTKATDANGGVVTYTYDAAGNRTAMTDPNNHTTTYAYDALNRLVQTTDPSSGVYQNGYDAVGNLISRKDPKGNTITYAYDVDNRRTGITYPSGTPVTFSYDANGNRSGMTDGLGASTYQYDDLNRMISSTDAYGKTITYGYDANSNRTAMTYPGNKTVTYSYDAGNRLKTVTDWLAHTTTYGYDAAGNLLNTLNPNGTTAAYAYDTAGRLTGLANAKADASVISNYSLTLDGVGNHTQSAQNEPLLPNIATQNTTYAYDSDNRLTAAGATACTYDANGNLTARGADANSYDFENRLTQAVVAGASSQYQYDGTGNRKSAITAAGTKRFILDTNGSLSRVLADTDGSGNINSYYIYGRGLISRIASSGAALYYHYDVRGSTIALSDASGNQTDQYAYDPFGKIANTLGSTANPFKYVGKYGVMDEGNGLAYIRARYFSPDFGRFITKDPLTGTDGDGQSLHRYVYALNNPIRFVDISGYSPQTGSSDDWHDFLLGVGIKGTQGIANYFAKKAVTKYLRESLVDSLINQGDIYAGKHAGEAFGFAKAGSVLIGIFKDGKSEIQSHGSIIDAVSHPILNASFAFNNPDAALSALKDGVDSTTAVTLNAIFGEVGFGFLPKLTGDDVGDFTSGKVPDHFNFGASLYNNFHNTPVGGFLGF